MQNRHRERTLDGVAVIPRVVLDVPAIRNSAFRESWLVDKKQTREWGFRKAEMAIIRMGWWRGNMSIQNGINEGLTVDSLIQTALKEPPDDESDKALWALRSCGTREVFETAKALISDGNVQERKLGVDILSQLGTPARVFREESIEILLSLLETELASDVICAIGWGLGHLEAKEGVEPMSKLSKDLRPEIRLAAVGGLLYQECELAVDTLIQLSTDEDDEVRSWATCGLGNAICLDNTRVREALFARLSDTHEETQQEAMYGLAKRKDDRIVVQLSKWLKDYPGFSSDLMAACDLGSPLLLPALNELEGHPDVDQDLLQKAIFSSRDRPLNH